jgi:hypothetical protein
MVPLVLAALVLIAVFAFLGRRWSPIIPGASLAVLGLGAGGLPKWWPFTAAAGVLLAIWLIASDLSREARSRKDSADLREEIRDLARRPIEIVRKLHDDLQGGKPELIVTTIRFTDQLWAFIQGRASRFVSRRTETLGSPIIASVNSAALNTMALGGSMPRKYDLASVEKLRLEIDRQTFGVFEADFKPTAIELIARLKLLKIDVRELEALLCSPHPASIGEVEDICHLFEDAAKAAVES